MDLLCSVPYGFNRMFSSAEQLIWVQVGFFYFLVKIFGEIHVNLISFWFWQSPWAERPILSHHAVVVVVVVIVIVDFTRPPLTLFKVYTKWYSCVVGAVSTLIKRPCCAFRPHAGGSHSRLSNGARPCFVSIWFGSFTSGSWSTWYSALVIGGVCKHLLKSSLQVLELFSEKFSLESRHLMLWCWKLFDTVLPINSETWQCFSQKKTPFSCYFLILIS